MFGVRGAWAASVSGVASVTVLPVAVPVTWETVPVAVVVCPVHGPVGLVERTDTVWLVGPVEFVTSEYTVRELDEIERLMQFV